MISTWGPFESKVIASQAFNLNLKERALTLTPPRPSQIKSSRPLQTFAQTMAVYVNTRRGCLL